MTYIIAVCFLMQSSPDEAITKLKMAIKKKDLSTLIYLSPDPNMEKVMTPDLFNRWIKDLQRDTNGNLNTVLGSIPTLGPISAGIQNIEIRFLLPLEEGAVSAEVQFQIVQDEWKIDELEFDWKELRAGGNQGIAKASPGDIVKAIHQAASNEDFENILPLLATPLRMSVNTATIRGLIQKEEARLKGKWLDTINRFPNVKESQQSISTLSMKVRLSVNEEGVTLSASMVKENGDWKLAAIETLLDGDQDDLEEDPAPLEKDPR